MAAPVFIDYNPATPITAAWLNDVSQVVYGMAGDGTNPPTTTNQLLKNLGVSKVVNSIAQLRTLLKTEVPNAFVTSYYGTTPYKGGGQYALVYQTAPGGWDNGGNQITAADGGGWQLLGNVVTPYNFGAYGDGQAGIIANHDDTTAIQAWLTALSPTLQGFWPDGVWNVSAQITKPASSHITIKTAGATNTIVNWIGAAGSTDVMVIGDGVTACSFWEIEGLGFEFAVKMTGGAALRLKKFMVYNKADVMVGVVTANGNGWHGLWLDLANVFYLTDINVTKMQGDGLRINGSASDDSGSDVFITRGNISFCAGAGFHQGGGMGGVRTGQLNSFVNGYNYLIDTAIVARKNREFFYEKGSVCDGATIAGIVFNDALTSNAPVTLSGFIGSTGQMGGVGAHHGVWVQNWPNGRFTVDAGQIFNHLGDGWHTDDVSCIASFSSETQFVNNSGYGINASADWPNCYYWGGYVALNGLGDFHPNTHCASNTSFTPVVTSSGGTLGAYTANMSWSTNGKTATWEMYIAITNIGTATGSLSITLPFHIRLASAVMGVDSQTNLSIHGFIASNAAIQSVSKFDGTFPAVNGSVLNLSGNCIIQ